MGLRLLTIGTHDTGLPHAIDQIAALIYGMRKAGNQ